MRFKITMIKELGKQFDETIIANNKNEAKTDAYSFKPRSKIVSAELIYK